MFNGNCEERFKKVRNLVHNLGNLKMDSENYIPDFTFFYYLNYWKTGDYIMRMEKFR